MARHMKCNTPFLLSLNGLTFRTLWNSLFSSHLFPAMQEEGSFFIRETVPVIQIHAFAKNCVHIPSFCWLQTLDKEGTLKIKTSILSINQQLPLLAPMEQTILVNLLQVQVINAD